MTDGSVRDTLTSMSITFKNKVPTRRDRLDRVPVIAHVNGGGRDRLLAAFEEVTVPAGSVILGCGARVEHLYLVGSGAVAATDDAGSLVMAGRGQPLGLRHLLRGELTSGAIVAVDETELWTMGRRQFISACHDVPGFALGILEASY